MARPHVVHLPNVPVRSVQISLPELLPRLRQALENQRDFRVEQLAKFDAVKRFSQLASRAPQLSPAVEEVQAMVVAGARRALSDIEIALARIQAGSYGRCRKCGNGISTSVLVAIPMTTLCLACQRQDECITYRRWSGRPITVKMDQRVRTREIGSTVPR